MAEHYAIEHELGRGGMATVYLARDLRHDRLVALKVLHPERAHRGRVQRPRPDWRDSVQCVLWYTMLALELLIARHAGLNCYRQLVERFRELDAYALSRQLVEQRLVLIAWVAA